MSKETLPFNFNEIYSYIENKFDEKGFDTQEGSNAMVLTTAMSHLVSLLNANTAANINENVLTLATQRKNIIKNAEVLGYNLTPIRSYQYRLRLRVNNTTGIEEVQNIQNGDTFTSGGNTFYYIGTSFAITVPANSTVYEYIDVIEATDLVDFSQVIADNMINIPHENVEKDGIIGLEVNYTYNSEAKSVLFSKTNSSLIERTVDLDVEDGSFLGTLSGEYIRRQKVDGTTNVLFNYANYGIDFTSLKDVNDSDIVFTVTGKALLSSGSQGSAGDTMIPVLGNVNANVTTDVSEFSATLTGADEESSEDIRINAPIYHNAANRVITKNDYQAFCDKYAKVKRTAVWDGNDEFPLKPGYVWLSFLSDSINRDIIPANAGNSLYRLDYSDHANNWFLSQSGNTSNVDEVFTELQKFGVPTLQYNHRNPIFLDFDFDIEVLKYSNAKTRAEQHNTVFNIVDSYFKDSIEKPDSEFFLSNLTKRIDTQLSDVSGINVSVNTSAYITTDNIVDLDGTNSVVIKLANSYEDTIDDNGVIQFNNLPVISNLLEPGVTGVNGVIRNYDDFQWQRRLVGAEKITMYELTSAQSSYIDTNRNFGNGALNVKFDTYGSIQPGFVFSQGPNLHVKNIVDGTNKLEVNIGDSYTIIEYDMEVERGSNQINTWEFNYNNGTLDITVTNDSGTSTQSFTVVTSNYEADSFYKLIIGAGYDTQGIADTWNGIIFNIEVDNGVLFSKYAVNDKSEDLLDTYAEETGDVVYKTISVSKDSVKKDGNVYTYDIVNTVGETTTVVGKYRLFRPIPPLAYHKSELTLAGTARNEIEVILYSDLLTIDRDLKLPIVYKKPNIKTTKNTIPRLARVEFI